MSLGLIAPDCDVKLKIGTEASSDAGSVFSDR
jgi:hypothetical protein